MPKDIGLSCVLCLNVDDPAGMLPVEIPHARFPQPAPTMLCRKCTLAIMKSAVASDLIDPSEVFPNAPAGDYPDRGPGDAPAPASASADLVPENQPDGGAPRVDGPEPEMPAGGADRDSEDS